MPSFDIVSKFDMQEVDNAVNIVKRDIVNRYDFKGSNSNIFLNKADKQIKIDKPILIIENNSKIKEISKLLTKFGYKKYYNKNGNLVKHINQNVLDIFFIFKKWN